MWTIKKYLKNIRSDSVINAYKLVKLINSFKVFMACITVYKNESDRLPYGIRK